MKIFGVRISLDQVENELNKNNFKCICTGNDKKLIIYLQKNKDVDIDKFKALVNKITNLMPKFLKYFLLKNLKEVRSVK